MNAPGRAPAFQTSPFWDLGERGMCSEEGEVQNGFFVGDLDGTLRRNSILMVLIVLLKEKENRSRKTIPV